MRNDGNRCVFFLLRVVAAFKAAFGSGKNHLGHMGYSPVFFSLATGIYLTVILGYLRTVLIM